MAERQESVREGIGAGAALAQTAAELGVAAATGGMSELGGVFGGGEDGGGEDYAPAEGGLPSWAPWAAGAVVLVLVVAVVATSSGGSGKKKAA